MRTDPAQVKERRCLSCGKPFRSLHKANRICARCHRREGNSPQDGIVGERVYRASTPEPLTECGSVEAEFVRP